VKVALLFVDAFAPGGYPRDVRWLADALLRRGVEVTILGRAGPCRDGAERVRSIEEQPAWPEAVREADLVHAFGVSDTNQLKAMRAVIDGASKIVVSPLAHFMTEHVRVRPWKKVPTYKVLGKMLERRRAGAHFFSALEEQQSRRFLRPVRSFLAGAGVFPAPTSEGESKRERDYLLFFGRNDVHQKGLDVLVASYAQALEMGLDLPLVIGGRAHGESERFLDDARRRLGERVRIVGETSDEERIRLMRGAAAFVFLSRWDGPPRPVREAVAVGTPVIVTDGTNMAHDVEGHNAGVRVDATVGSVSAALLQVEDRAVLAGWLRGVEELRSALSWDNIAGLHVDGYESYLKA
jgi:glycosyltransferase involved in cell wall biosynthesis